MNSEMRIKFFTLGCKVNQYETQALKEKFSFLGYMLTQKKADLYIINSCSVTHKADKKSREAIARAKKENPKAIVVVCGCLAQSNEEDLKKLEVDYVISQDKKHILPEIVLGMPLSRVDSKLDKGIWSLQITHFSNQRAFLKVQDGCDNFCSFCKIPYLRGPARSRSMQAVIEEVKRLSVLHKEIVLCGVNLSLYGNDFKPAQSLAVLIGNILSISSLGRLRLSSLEAFYLDEGIFSYFKNKRLCPHLHLPFQYGDDEVLGKMGKKENVALYEKKVSEARAVNPDIAISCDVMVGFPSEDEHSFDNTVAFLERIRPMRMHVFTFSPREKTPLSKVKITNQKEVYRRYLFLKNLADKFSYQYAEKFKSKPLNMIAERREDGFISGYTENYIRVFIKENVALGDIIPVEIIDISQNKVFVSLAA